MIYWILFFLPLLISPAFGQTSAFDEHDSLEYILKFDNHVYHISYVVNGDVLAMDIDPESKSLLVGLENTLDSKFSISLNRELISVTNNEFVVLVNGQDADYKIMQNLDNFTISFFVPAGTQEVEIIGTSIIPEFPIGAIFGLIVMVSSIVIFTKVKTSFFML